MWYCIGFILVLLSCARSDHCGTAIVSRFFSDSNHPLDLTRRGTTACLARYYRLRGTTAPQERYYRVLCGTKSLLPPQPWHYRALARYYCGWSSTNILVPQAVAVLPWLTSIACQLSRMPSMCFLCFFVAFALIFSRLWCFACVSQVVALACPTPVVTLAPNVCATQVKYQKARLPPSAMSSTQLASTRSPLRAWMR